MMFKQRKIISSFSLFFALLFTFISAEEECLFCKPEVIQRQLVAESSYWWVLLNYIPIVPGHLMIIPKAHHVTRYELSLEEFQDLYGVEKKVKGLLKKRFGAKIEDLQYEKNSPILQTVHHYHIHVLPITPEYASYWERMKLMLRLFVYIPHQLTPEELHKEQEAYQ